MVACKGRKNKMKEFTKYLLTSFIYILLCIPTFLVLKSWLNVREMKHYIFLSNLQNNGNRKYFSKLDISYSLSSSDDGKSVVGEFIYMSSPKDSFENKIKEIPRYDFFKIIGGDISKYKRELKNENIDVKKISDFISIIDFEKTDFSLSLKQPEYFKINPEKSVIRILRRTDPKELIGALAKKEFSILDSCNLLENNKSYFGPILFNINKDNLTVIQDYILRKDNIETVTFKTHKNFSVNIFHQLLKYLAFHDISKEGHRYYIFINDIDTVSLKIKFDDEVELSSLKREPDIEDATSLYYRNIKNNTNSLKNALDYQNYAISNNITFWVKYSKGERMQWVRLFIITTLLGFFITESITYLGKALFYNPNQYKKENS